MLIHQQRLETVSANSQRNKDRQHSAFPIIVLSDNIGNSQRKVQKQPWHEDWIKKIKNETESRGAKKDSHQTDANGDSVFKRAASVDWTQLQ